MSVMIVTSLGDIVVDLLTDRCPLTTKNFLKLCKMKYYNGCLFHKVEKDFMAQTGDPTGTGTGGDSVFKFLYGEQARFFDDEIHPDIKHSKIGTVAMASAGENCNASQFYFTLRDELDYLDGKHTVFGTVEEKDGLDTLVKINEAFVDDNARPFKDVRIKHTYILDDPFDDPPQIAEFIPEKSPEGKPHDETAQERLEDNWVPMEETLTAAELEEVIRTKEAHTNAAILESIGDIPDADIKPPENVLFVCKLNPVTQDEDLHTIFSRFGNVISADIIRDYKTGDSLCYAFIEFETNDACERAYFKMDNTLIDDRRIHVDFSQSVSKLWKQFRHGKRSQTNAGGCFKCGALDHIARDCDDDPNNKQRGTKFVMKNEYNQYGENGHQRYDMLFDEDDLERRGTKVRKEVHEKQEDSKYRDYDKKNADKFRSGDDRSGGSRKEERNQESRRVDEYRHEKSRGGSREEERNQESRRVDEYRREKSRGGSREEERNRESRSVDEHRREKSKGQERYDGHEQKKHHERSSSRHWRDDRDHSRSSGGGQHEREHRKRSMDHLIRQDDGHNKMRSRNRDDGP